MPARRFAFTMVEVLVVILIIGLLVAISVPAVNAVRRNARRTECLDRMRQLGRAVQTYEGSKNYYPGWRQWLRRQAPAGKVQAAWPVLLLPELDRRDVYDVFLGQTSAPTVPQIDIFVCPADPDKRDSAQPWLSFVANAGMPDAQSGQANPPGTDFKANGIFHDQIAQPALRMNSRYIAQGDGLALTLLLSENLAAGQYHQWQSEFFTTMVFLVNPGQESLLNGSENRTPGYVRARPSSLHDEGVNVVFANGNGRFLSDKIDYRVYRELMTPRGNQARNPQDNASVPPYGKLTPQDLEL